MTNKIRGAVSSYQLNLVNTAGAYVAGQAIGGTQELQGAAIKGIHSGKIVGASVFNNELVNADLDLLFFSNAAAALSIDNSEFFLQSSQDDQFIGLMEIRNHKTYGTRQVSWPDINQRDIPYEVFPEASTNGSQGDSLFMVAVIQSPATFVTVNDLHINVFLQHSGT